MRVIFFGSSQFAVPSLEALIGAGYDVACVVTQPDRKSGRGLHLHCTPVKELALRHKLQLFQPQDINSAQAVKFLKELKPELCLIIAYGQMLSQEVLDIPKIIFLNLHASLLPAYRGAAPIHWALIREEKETGVSVMKVVRKMDAGPVMLQAKIKITCLDTAVTLESKLAEIGAQAVLQALTAIKNNDFKLNEQNEDKASYASKLKKSDGLINWSDPAEKIHDLVCGMVPWPGAFTYHKGKMIKILKAKSIKCSRRPLVDVVGGRDPDRVKRASGQVSSVKKPGEIIEVGKNVIIVVTGKDCLEIYELQPEGKRAMSAQEFIAGHRIDIGEALGLKS